MGLVGIECAASIVTLQALIVSFFDISVRSSSAMSMYCSMITLSMSVVSLSAGSFDACVWLLCVRAACRACWFVVWTRIGGEFCDARICIAKFDVILVSFSFKFTAFTNYNPAMLLCLLLVLIPTLSMIKFVPLFVCNFQLFTHPIWPPSFVLGVEVAFVMGGVLWRCMRVSIVAMFGAVLQPVVLCSLSSSVFPPLLYA